MSNKTSHFEGELWREKVRTEESWIRKKYCRAGHVSGGTLGERHFRRFMGSAL